MSTLDRYILRTFTRNLALVLLTLAALYGLIEFLEKVDDFLEYQAALKYYLLYPLFHLPVILANSLPMAVLLATFATIGGFSRTSQLTAMLCGGISFGRLSRPLLLGGLTLSLFMLLGNLWLVPWAAQESNFILRTEIRGSGIRETISSDLYFRDGKRIISVVQAFPAKNFVLGLTVLEFDDSFTPVKRIQAGRATHEEGSTWRLEDVVTWEFSPGSRGAAAFARQPEVLYDLERRPSEMLQLWDRPEDLTINELLQNTTKLQNEGYDAKAYQMEAQMRFAKAAIPVIMVLLGIPFALQRGRNASFALGIVISLAIFFVYFICYAIFAVFGAIAVLPAPLAAWAANLLMALCGTWFFLRVQG